MLYYISMNRNKKLLDEFVKYCEQHPQLRFWQALITWSGFGYIYASELGEKVGTLLDTFYWENKNN